MAVTSPVALVASPAMAAGNGERGNASGRRCGRCGRVPALNGVFIYLCEKAL